MTESIRSLAKNIRSSSQNIWSIIWNYTILKDIDFRSAEAWLSVPEMNLTFIRVFLYQSVAVENDTIIKYWVCKIPFVRIFYPSAFLKFRLSKSFSLLFQKSDSFQIRNPQKVKFKKLEKTHPQLQKLLLFTFCLMRLTPFRYDFNRERFLSLGGARASLETDPYFYPLSTKGF